MARFLCRLLHRNRWKSAGPIRDLTGNVRWHTWHCQACNALRLTLPMDPVTPRPWGWLTVRTVAIGTVLGIAAGVALAALGAL